MKALTLFSLFAIASSVVFAQDAKVDLTRHYKAAETHRYKLNLKVDIDGAPEMSATLETKVDKMEDTTADIQLKVTEFKSPEGEGPTLEPAKLKFDAFGMPESLGVQNEQALYTAFAVCGYLPGKALAVNDTFKIDWKTKGDRGSISGDGQLVSIKTDGDRKIAVVKSKITVSPAEHQDPATLDTVSEFDLATGALISSTAKGKIGDGTVTISVKEVK